MDNNDKRIDDIINMLDSFASQNVGKVNLKIDENLQENCKKIDTANSLDCSGNMACKVPTLFEGVDDNNR